LQESTSPETGARLDLPSITLLVLGTGALAWGVVRFESPGWGPPLAAGVLGIGLLALLARWVRGRPSAALDLSLFDDRGFLYVNLATAVFGVAFAVMLLGSFLFLMGVWGYSQGAAGWAITPLPLTVIPVDVAAGRLAGGLLYALAQAWLVLRLDRVPDFLGIWLPAQLLGGVAVGLVLPALSGAAVAKLGPARFGVGGGVNNALRQMGGAIGAALAVALVGRADAGLAQFQTLYGLMSVLGLATALLCLPVDTRPLAARVAPT
jgi:hypothetical protein